MQQKKETSYTVIGLLIRIVFIVVMGWIVFSFADYLYEVSIVHSDNITAWLWFITPVVYAVLYGLKRKKILSTVSHKIGAYFIAFGLWTAVNFLFGALIIYLVNTNHWFFNQEFHYVFEFNGLEYAIFPFFNLVLTFVLSLLIEFVLWIIRVCKR